MENEFPYQIVEQKSATLFLKKWVFSVAHVSISSFLCLKIDHSPTPMQEAAAMEDTVALSLFYQQAAADIRADSIDVGEHGSRLRMMKAQGEQREVQRPDPISLSHTHTHSLSGLSLSGLSLWSLSLVSLQGWGQVLSNVLKYNYKYRNFSISTSTVAVAGKYLSTTVSTHG